MINDEDAKKLADIFLEAHKNHQVHIKFRSRDQFKFYLASIGASLTVVGFIFATNRLRELFTTSWNTALSRYDAEQRRRTLQKGRVKYNAPSRSSNGGKKSLDELNTVSRMKAEGYSTAEIAASMGIHEAKVRNYVHDLERDDS